MDWTAIRGCRAGFVPFLVVVVMTVAGCGDSNQQPAEVQLNVCRHTCEQAPDCGEPDNWMCIDGLCEVSPLAAGRCQHDRQCWAKFSGWTETDCREDGCPRGEACVLVGNVVYCASEAPPQQGCPVGTPYDAELADGSGRVDVCANQQARCEEGVCRDPCDSDADCGGERTCDTSSGRCLCTADSDCAGELVCARASGECICRNDADCTGEGAGTCFDGTCGCADDEACGALGENYDCTPASEES